MRIESEYRLTAESEEAILKIATLWGDVSETNGCTFEDYASDVIEIMEKVLRVVDKMEKTGEKFSFHITGGCESDYDCIIFAIDYSGAEPTIKSSQADPEENEGRFYQFCEVCDEADDDEILRLLKRNKNRTFKQAIKDDIPLGAFLDISYDEWVRKTLSE